MESRLQSVSALCLTTGLGTATTQRMHANVYTCNDSPSIGSLAPDSVLKPVTQNTVPKNVQRFERVDVGGKMVKQATEVCAYLPVW